MKPSALLAALILAVASVHALPIVGDNSTTSLDSRGLELGHGYGNGLGVGGGKLASRGLSGQLYPRQDNSTVMGK